MYQFPIRLPTVILIIIQILPKSKTDLILENISLGHQLSVYKSKQTKPRLTDVDRSLWVALRPVWTKWRDCLVVVKPETVINWQKRRFGKHWAKISSQNKQRGRTRIKTVSRYLRTFRSKHPDNRRHQSWRTFFIPGSGFAFGQSLSNEAFRNRKGCLFAKTRRPAASLRMAECRLIELSRQIDLKSELSQRRAAS